MKRYTMLAATVLLLGLAAVKFLIPQAGAELRDKVRTAVEREVDYAEAFLRVNAATAQDTAEPTQSPQTTPAQSQSQKKYLDVRVTPPVSSDAPVPTPSPDPEPEPEPEPTPLPDAVTTFLESQAAFADYEVPEKADLSYVVLPFAYTVPVLGYSSSGYGYRVHPILNTVRFHFGTDFAANAGENVLAFADGTVTFAGYDESYGWHIRIDHGQGWETLYAHCSQLFVSAEQQVARGDRIALVGATGLATGPHLHFELCRDGKYFNPEYYFSS